MERIGWIDKLKAVCILFVMLAHLESAWAIPQALYTPFFLNGFLFAAGYVYRQEQFSVFFWKKVRTLLIPWLVFSTGNLALSQLVTFQTHGNFWQELAWNLLQIRGQGDGLWFVAALFVSFFPFYGLIRWQERRKGGGVLLCAVGILWAVGLLYEIRMDPALLPWNSRSLPWHLEYIPQALLFMTLGYLSRRKDPADRGVFCTAVYCLLVIPGLLGLRLYPVLAGLLELGAEICGVLALAALCRKLPDTGFLSVLGQNTLICFALHGKVMSLLEWSLKRFLPEGYAAMLGHGLASSLLAAILTAGMALVLLIPIYILNRWFPFLLGRKRCAAKRHTGKREADRQKP